MTCDYMREIIMLAWKEATPIRADWKRQFDVVNSDDGCTVASLVLNAEGDWLSIIKGGVELIGKKKECSAKATFITLLESSLHSEINYFTMLRDGVKALEAEPVCRISGIIFEHGVDDFGLWTEFSLSEEDEAALWCILSKYDTSGTSIRGTRKDIADEFLGKIS